MKVFKYPIPIDDDFAIRMPMGAKILTVQMQGSQPCIWALVEEGVREEDRRFLLRGTGHEVCGDVLYVGTFQMQGGALVFHLFEPLPPIPPQG